MSDITAADKLACVNRELAMRRNVYPKFVSSGRMSQQKADREIAVMEAIVTEFEQRPIPVVVTVTDVGAKMVVRNAALEEAAKVCEIWEGVGGGPGPLADAIRAMKVNP